MGVTLFFTLAITLCGCLVHPEKQPADIVLPYSFAKDSILVRVTNLASQITRDDTIHMVYYADQSLKSGKQIEEMIEKFRAGLLKRKFVFAGLGHFGYFRSKRRRDFILPSVKEAGKYQGRSDDYGQADSFYNFLTTQVIPVAEFDFKGRTIQRSFIGHSLGGLFATYLLVNNDSLFDNLYALSPSLWIDDYHALRYESEQKSHLEKSQKKYWVSCGSGETLNRIVGGIKRLSDTLERRHYPGIKHQVKYYPGESHNSSVLPALEDIFRDFTADTHSIQ